MTKISAGIDGQTETLCIFGHPVAHSKSPAMHNALFDALHINARYLPYAPEPENFADAIRGFRSMGFRGANVTIPYKTEFTGKDGTPKLIDELSAELRHLLHRGVAREGSVLVAVDAIIFILRAIGIRAQHLISERHSAALT